jgi:predicted transcriptional regulator
MFREALKRAMTERDVSQTRLAELSGVGKSSISQYLSGKNVPNDRAKQKLADALDVEITYFNDQNVSIDRLPESRAIKNLTVEQAARELGKSKQFVRVSLQTGSAPFGYAVKVSGDKWSYHISPKKFYEYAGV